MNCVKIIVLVSLIPLVLRGASLLGNVVAAIPSPSPEQERGFRNAASVGASAPQVAHWRHRGRRREMEQSRLAASTPRRFGGGNGGRYGGFFRDEKRFAPTGSNPLHNL